MLELERLLGRQFNNKSYLRTALTHSSYANENRSCGECNERLEFLGDAVLGFVVAEYLYRRHPDMPEGRMTRLRADMVCEKSLAAVALKLRLGDHMYLGHGESVNGGRQRPSIQADAVEALIAALYLDGGLQVARSFIDEHIIAAYEADMGKVDTDFKTRLQELVQRRPGSTLHYEPVGEEGPDHNKVFTVRVLVDGKPVAVGAGRSKKEAEQSAARAALEILR